jgi:hypothetical protein
MCTPHCLQIGDVDGAQKNPTPEQTKKKVQTQKQPHPVAAMWNFRTPAPHKKENFYGFK